MLKKMLKILSENYKKYLPWTIVAFIPTIIASIFFKSDHIIISNIVLALAYFCGFWFADIQNFLYPNINKSNYKDLIIPFLVFVLIFLIISFVARVCFGYSYGILRMLFCFAIATFVKSRFNKA